MTDADPLAGLSAAEREAVLAYRAAAGTVTQISQAAGLERTAFYQMLDRVGEPRRHPERARGRSRRAKARATEPLGRRLERMLASRIAELEARPRRGRKVDPEAEARALAIHVRSFQALRRADPSGGQDPEPEPTEPAARSLGELRDELRRHLERIRDEERARRGLAPDEAEPG